jgi:methionyl-tRNA formyltransferase
LRVVFMGTPEFALPALEACMDAHEVVAVYTQPDRAKGRGRHELPSPVKERALASGVPVEQPTTLRDAAAIPVLRAYAPDAIVVAAYGLLLPPDVLAIPPLGCVNVHASLLPRWRGAAPIQRAILAGDGRTGVCIMRMEAGLDTGPTARCAPTGVDEKSASDLTSGLARLGATALASTLAELAAGTVAWTPQPETGVTYAAKLTSEDVALDPSLTAEECLRRVRASGPSAPCRVVVGGRLLTVLAARRCGAHLASGEASCSVALALGVADGTILLDRVVPAGRRPMSGESFARGSRLEALCAWEPA